MLYQLKHLNTGNFLKYPGWFPDCKNIQVISPSCLLPLPFRLFQFLLTTSPSTMEKQAKKLNLNHFGWPVLWAVGLVYGGRDQSYQVSRDTRTTDTSPSSLEIVSLFSLIKTIRSLLLIQKKKKKNTKHNIAEKQQQAKDNSKRRPLIHSYVFELFSYVFNNFQKWGKST